MHVVWLKLETHTIGSQDIKLVTGSLFLWRAEGFSGERDEPRLEESSMKRPESHRTGELGEAYAAQMFLQAGWIVTKLQPD